MMPEVLLKLGLEEAVKEVCNNISAGKIIKVTFQSYGVQQRLSPSTEVMLFRILQELLNNIIKHSSATEALVQFNVMDNSLIITVEDNGKGFIKKADNTSHHAGLSGINNRVNYLKGKLSIESDTGIGTTVTMEFLLNHI
jgi:signal transduction histidine kinase